MQERAMEVKGDYVKGIQLHTILHMNGGDGNKSYANNSFFQKEVMLKVKPILQESIKELYSNNLPECITMADLGCSSGPNTFLPIWEVIEAIDETCHRLNRKAPMLQVFLNDLPENDFNSIFKSLPNFYRKLEEDQKCSKFIGPCLVAAMPGTFYGRLFPPQSLHFVHSSYSLQWCSKVPKIPMNKGNIYPSKTSHPDVHKAYLNQFERDFKAFLSCRSKEIIPGGRMVLTIYGRDDNTTDFSNSSGWDLLGIMLNDMVSEGLIEESKLDSFNLPFYGASAEEVKKVIESEGSFNINRFESFNIGWDASIDDDLYKKDSVDKYTKGKYVANHMRAILESILTTHFGAQIIDLLFQRFSIKIGDFLETANGAYTSHTISLTKESTVCELGDRP